MRKIMEYRTTIRYIAVVVTVLLLLEVLQAVRQ
jgi:hypothetical protein